MGNAISSKKNQHECYVRHGSIQPTDSNSTSVLGFAPTFPSSAEVYCLHHSANWSCTDYRIYLICVCNSLSAPCMAATFVVSMSYYKMDSNYRWRKVKHWVAWVALCHHHCGLHISMAVDLLAQQDTHSSKPGIFPPGRAHNTSIHKHTAPARPSYNEIGLSGTSMTSSQCWAA